jgi:hypothetical protein
LGNLVRNIPNSILEADSENEFYKEFKTYPKELSKAEAWEKRLDSVLNRAVGWNRSVEDISAQIRRGPNGVSSILNFMHQAIVVHEIDPGLLQGKVNKLCEALELLCVSCSCS